MKKNNLPETGIDIDILNNYRNKAGKYNAFTETYDKD